jgi:transcriptional regulator with XRE-family HTH domain
MEQKIEAIAYNLKNLRESRGLSLDQLSEITGVSKSMLRQIETGKSSPTIATLWKITNGLRISFTALIRKPDIKAEVRQFKSGEPLTDEAKHYRLFPLIPFEPEQSFETYYFELDPFSTFHGTPHNGTVYEYVFVTEGELEMFVDEKVFTVKSGEFIQFKTDCAHQYKCTSRNTLKAIMQLTYLP